MKNSLLTLRPHMAAAIGLMVALMPAFAHPTYTLDRQTSFATSGRLGRARTALVVRTVKLGKHPGPIAIDSRTRRIFVVEQGPFAPGYRLPTGFGRLAILDADTGKLLRTVTLGKGPSGVVVSERTGRVFEQSALR